MRAIGLILGAALLAAGIGVGYLTGHMNAPAPKTSTASKPAPAVLPMPKPVAKPAVSQERVDRLEERLIDLESRLTALEATRASGPLTTADPTQPASAPTTPVQDGRAGVGLASNQDDWPATSAAQAPTVDLDRLAGEVQRRIPVPADPDARRQEITEVLQEVRQEEAAQQQARREVWQRAQTQRRVQRLAPRLGLDAYQVESMTEILAKAQQRQMETFRNLREQTGVGGPPGPGSAAPAATDPSADPQQMFAAVRAAQEENRQATYQELSAVLSGPQLEAYKQIEAEEANQGNRGGRGRRGNTPTQPDGSPGTSPQGGQQ